MLIFRRWKISLPLLLVAIGATTLVALTAKPDYTMTSYVQLIPAKIAPSDNPTAATLRNPWNQLGLNTLGQAAIYATQDQGFLDSLKAEHHTDNFTLTMTYPNPIVTVEVVGTTKDDALTTTQMVVDRLRGAAESLQRGSGVGDADIIATQRLDRGQNLVPSTGKVKRAIAAVAAAGLVLTAGGAVGGDAILRRRARKRQEALDAESDDGQPLEPASGKVGVDRSAVNGVNGTNGKNVDAPPVMPQFARAALPESVERTAIIIKRTSSVVKAEPPKQQRRSPAATYRSANAQDANGEAAKDDEKEKEPVAEANGAKSADPSDVRAVLQPNRMGGDDGGQSK